jgi:prophage antirepressor-like protein
LEVKTDFWEKPQVVEEQQADLEVQVIPQIADPVVLEGEVVEAENVEPEVSESKDLIPHVFSFKGDPVRTTIVDGEVMFHGDDVCKILGYVHTYKAIEAHCKYAKILKASELDGLEIGPRGAYCFPESDLYRLTLRSNMPDADVFQDWICETVIPTLRKTGRYQIGPPEAQVPATIDNRQLTVLIESMAKRDDQFERLLVANTVEPEVSESKDIIPHEFAFKGDPVRTPLLTVR